MPPLGAAASLPHEAAMMPTCTVEEVQLRELVDAPSEMGHPSPGFITGVAEVKEEVKEEEVEEVEAGEDDEEVQEVGGEMIGDHQQEILEVGVQLQVAAPIRGGSSGWSWGPPAPGPCLACAGRHRPHTCGRQRMR